VIASAATAYHFVAPAKGGAHPSAAAMAWGTCGCVADEGWGPAFAGTTVSKWVGDVA
jgi:hypothetical protein